MPSTWLSYRLFDLFPTRDPWLAVNTFNVAIRASLVLVPVSPPNALAPGSTPASLFQGRGTTIQ